MVTINIGRKEAVFFGVIILVLAVVGLGVAFGGNTPGEMGHSLGEIEKCGDGEFLVMSGGKWTCGNSAAVVVQFHAAEDHTYRSISSTFPYDNTIPQITEGGFIMSTTFTPKKSDSTLIIEGIIAAGTVGNSAGAISGGLFASTQSGALATGWNENRGATSSGGSAPMVIKHVMPSGSTATRTFSLRGSNMEVNGQSDGSRTDLYGNSLKTIITVTEIMA